MPEVQLEASMTFEEVKAALEAEYEYVSMAEFPLGHAMPDADTMDRLMAEVEANAPQKESLSYNPYYETYIVHQGPESQGIFMFKRYAYDNPMILPDPEPPVEEPEDEE